MMTKTRTLAAATSVLALAVAASLAGCSDDDDNNNPGSSSGTSGTSGASGTSGSSGSSGTSGTSGTTDGGADAGTLSLYERLGGQAGLEAFVKNVVETKILTDADLKTFFFNQVKDPIPAGHPSAKQITVCFARLVGAALKEGAYPGAPVEDTANTNTPMHTCRDMVASHKGTDTMLNIGSGNFDKFIGYIAADLQPLVKPTATKAGEITQGEFDALAAALTATKTDVTTAGAPSTGPFVAP